MSLRFASRHAKWKHLRFADGRVSLGEARLVDRLWQLTM